MQAQKYSIKDWASDDRPREKLLSKNPQALSVAELLAILINNGTREHSALDLAKEILRQCGQNLLQLGKLSIKDFMKVKGIGIAKAITLTATMELARRRQASESLDKRTVKGSHDIAGYLRAMLQDRKMELFAVVFIVEPIKSAIFKDHQPGWNDRNCC